MSRGGDWMSRGKAGMDRDEAGRDVGPWDGASLDRCRTTRTELVELTRSDKAPPCSHSHMILCDSPEAASVSEKTGSGYPESPVAPAIIEGYGSQETSELRLLRVGVLIPALVFKPAMVKVVIRAGVGSRERPDDSPSFLVRTLCLGTACVHP